LTSPLDHQERRVSLAAKFDAAVQHVDALTDAVLGIANDRVVGAAE